MRIVNNLANEDYLRSQQIQTNTRMYTEAFTAQVFGCVMMADDIARGTFQAIQNATDRQRAFIGLFYRAISFGRSATVLNGIEHSQSLTSAERSLIEINVDMNLLHRNVFQDGVDRFTGFVEAQRLKAARRAVEFFANNPQLDETPSKAQAQADFIANHGVRVNARNLALWGASPSGQGRIPAHWSQQEMLSRCRQLPTEIQLRVIEGYDMRNFAIHTGMAGIVGVNREGFEIQCALAVQNIAECMVSTLRIVGAEFTLQNVTPDYADIVEDMSNIHVHALTDCRLQSIGEERRFWIEP